MTDPNPRSLYQQQFNAAVELFDNGHLDKCIAEAKKNLTQAGAPLHYYIQYTNFKQRL